MDTLQHLFDLVHEIDELCEKLIRIAVPVMRSIIAEKDKIIQQIKTSHPELTETFIKDKLQERSLSLVKDAKLIKRELGNFCTAIATNMEINSCSNIVFLKEVWCGDVYDHNGVDALEELINDLKHQIATCTVKNIVDSMHA